MSLEEITEIIADRDGVLIYFWGDNCNVCEALRPKFKEEFDRNFPKIEQFYINAKENIEISSFYGVFSIPTMIVFLDGKEFIREGRAVSMSRLVSKLQRPYSMLLG